MNVRPGRWNSILDVAGIQVGNAEDRRVRTGVTVVLPEQPVVGAVDVRGGAPGTCETEVLDPLNTVNEVHAVVLSGGSAFGLDGAGAVRNRLAARGIGFRVADAVVPIVPAAILFDLGNGGVKDWEEEPPYRRLALEAVAAAGSALVLGSTGAGAGARAGSVAGGLGSASAVCPVSGCTVAALVAVNSVGEPGFPDGRTLLAWYLEQEGEMGGQAVPSGPIPLELRIKRTAAAGANTTIGVVATDAPLMKVQAKRMAVMAHDGLAVAIRPIHTPWDGDTMFALATGRQTLEVTPALLTRLGALAADCTARAVARGILAADGHGSTPSWRERAVAGGSG
ncbi:MAG TPA: P1 family peptidase [Geminicoccus sp.]|uniref:P1 family peptidase n=1 Tax=Geminicoccus sp. TaxID=2024832 RepID=UPI002E32CF5B|nr:P1 family peptidase [Geminicoccus sp.]HEX2525251.1 P1 family peptidase [Geminicoccus sp.]